ncbi:MAG TPA: hypothetical protein VMD59_12045 [Acidimicrobiales bacterium]|nr:hypothetical protein [Acidimicrobiales bacterium]
MTQPRFAPITEDGEVRAAYRLAPPRPWSPHRAAELSATTPLRGPGRGVPGPDQGYALGLARRIAPRLVLRADEHADDVLAGAVAIALVRAALFGRAPVMADLEVALGAFGFLAEAPEDLVEARRAAFAGAAHDYLVQRGLAGLLPERRLRSTPDEAAGATAEVRQLLAAARARRVAAGALAEREEA